MLPYGISKLTRSGFDCAPPTTDLIKEIDEIREGFRSDTFQRLLKRKRIRQEDEHCAFTIMYNNHQKELHLMAENKQMRDLWVMGLKHLTERCSNSGHRTFQYDMTSERALSMIEQYEMNLQWRNQHLLGIDGFRNLMLSEEFDLMKQSCAQRPYQDMTKPLTHYYINTSHNTYLFQSQVYGDSNAEAYNRVLLKGGRAVEQDLLTKALPTTNPSVLPSPEDLKMKVLLRSRQIAQRTRTTVTLQQEDEDDSPIDPLSEVMHPDFAQLLIYMQNVPFRGFEYAHAN
ncbi:unnamed protein product, partial [Didymodactylos carnosus]